MYLMLLIITVFNFQTIIQCFGQNDHYSYSTSSALLSLPQCRPAPTAQVPPYSHYPSAALLRLPQCRPTPTTQCRPTPTTPVTPYSHYPSATLLRPTAPVPPYSDYPSAALLRLPQCRVVPCLSCIIQKLQRVYLKYYYLSRLKQINK